MAYTRPTLFYGLREIGGHVRYIGKTDGTLPHRLKQHLNVAVNGKEMHRPVYVWIADCIASGIEIEIVKLAECEPSQLVGHWLNETAIESCLVKSYMRFAKTNGRPPLLNVAMIESRHIVLSEAVR
jgi:hypothetical protein